jgi:hypothetical protein
LLDTGHLMNANPGLNTEREGLVYIHQALNRHGELCRYIRGIHLNRSLSGAYVWSHIGRLPKDLLKKYVVRFGTSYRHILQIDQHQA